MRCHIGPISIFAFRIVDAHDAILSIDFATGVLLVSMMLILANLHLARVFD
jgi:hypothetical protein